LDSTLRLHPLIGFQPIAGSWISSAGIYAAEGVLGCGFEQQRKSTLISNFTVHDALGILLVLPSFSLVLVAPGYLIGLASNVLGFRGRGLSERLLLALAISGAVSPFAINFLCRFFPIWIVSALFLLLGIGFLARLLLEWRRSKHMLQVEMHRTTKLALCLVTIWVLVCLVSLPDMQLGQKIYSTAAAWDYSVRSPFIASALRTGAPPANPFFYPGHFVNARYYYYWNVLSAVPAFVSGSSARITLYGSCIWGGLLLASMIPIYLKHFLERRSQLRVASVVGIAMLAITGLDLIPTLGIIAFSHVHPPADMEWWDTCQVTSWLDALIWVPHHVAALVACLAGYLFLWKAVGKGEISTRIWLIIVAALGFSSAAGLSVYVTFTFGFFILVWMAYLLLRGRILAVVFHGAAGALALMLSIGYIRDLLGPGTNESAPGGSSSHFVALALRQLPLGFDFHNHLVNLCVWVLLAFLLLFFELGIYMVVGLRQAGRDWRQWRSLSEAQKALWFMGGSTLFVIMFIRSTVIGANDLAWRGAMVLQFVLLLWVAIYLADRLTTHRPRATGPTDQKLFDATLVMLLVIGGASSLYQLSMLRVYTFLSERYHWTDFMQLANGGDAYFLRRAYAESDHVVPSNAVVQYNPDTQLSTPMLIYSRYQQADAGGSNCLTEFGGSMAQCPATQVGLKAIFDPQLGDKSSKAEVDEICQSLHINVLLVNALDPVWNRKDSWVWQDTPIIQNEFVRVYGCGSGH
jgi:hypothetical protein